MATEPVFGRRTSTGWNAHRPKVSSEEKRASERAIGNLPSARLTPSQRKAIQKMLRGER